jgi:uncharacterized protein YicC (UPF0701 family)
VSEHIELKKEELHAAITTATMLERRILELQRDGASLDEINMLIDQRVHFQRDTARLNLEIDNEVLAANLKHFMRAVDQYDAARRAEHEELRGLLTTRLDRVEGRVDDLERRLIALEAARGARQ